MKFAAKLAVAAAALWRANGQSVGLQNTPNPIETYYIPLPEQAVYSHTFLTINTIAKPPITTLVSCAVAADGTWIWFDHHEDGYEGDIKSISQDSTEVWGDNNAANGCAPGLVRDGVEVPCTDEDDYLRSGDAVVMNNKIPLPRTDAILYDGGDKVQASFPIAMTRGAYPETPGALMAGAVEVLKTQNWGTEYISPIGQGMPILEDTTQAFQYTAFFVMAESDGTIVNYKNGGVLTLSEGETGIVPNVATGDRVTSNKPVQVDIIAGDVGSNYELRWYSLISLDDWSNDYYTPVGTDDVRTTRVWMYNPNDEAITIRHQRNKNFASEDYEIPARTNMRSSNTGAGTGSRFYSKNGQKFFAITQTDADEFTNSRGWKGTGHVYDWGHPLVPASDLTSQALVGLGIGCAESSGTECSGNAGNSRAVVWVSPVARATIFVDKNGDGIADEQLTVGKLVSLQFRDDSDHDMTGAIIWAIHPKTGLPVDIVVAWGQDPTTSGFGDPPALDLGTVVPPLPIIAANKFASVRDRSDGIAQPGDYIDYTIRIVNVGQVDFNAAAFVVTDLGNMLTATDYVKDSTSYHIFETTDGGGETIVSSTPIADSSEGTPFPGDEGIPGTGILERRGGAHGVSFSVRVKDGFQTCPDSIVNEGDVSPQGGGEELDSFRTETPLFCPLPASIENFVWEDTNHDGVQSSGEPGISNVGVALISSGPDRQLGTADDTMETQETDSSGKYLFEGLDPNWQYRVEFDLPEGYEEFTHKDVDANLMDTVDSDADADGLTGLIPLKSGETNSDFDAGVKPFDTAEIKGRVWNDIDRDGVQDAGELPVGGATVKLHGPGADGELGTDDDTVTETVTSDVGSYAFDNLKPFLDYQVEFVLPGDFDAFSPANSQETDDQHDSDADGTGATGGYRTSTISLEDGDVSEYNDAGVVNTPATVEAYVWNDTNNNGIQDAGEVPVPGSEVVLIIRHPNGKVEEVVQVTDETGLVVFTELDTKLEYQLKFETPYTYDFSPPDQGPNPIEGSDGDFESEIDSDADPSTGLSDSFSLSPGEHKERDAGVVPIEPATLIHTVWEDEDGNGIQDKGEQPISGATVTLLGAGPDGLFDTADDHKPVVATTPVDGTVQFDGLVAGEPYKTIFTRPEDFQDFTLPLQGDSIAVDSNAHPLTGATSEIILGAGETNDTYDAGVTPFPPTFIVGKVWHDANTDGTQDEGSAEDIQGALVKLHSAGEDGVFGTDDDPPVLETVTNGEGGMYTFEDIDPDHKYKIEFVLPEGYDTYTSQGTDSAPGSDGFTSEFEVPVGETHEVDAGLVITPASLGGQVFLDNDGNGVQNEGDDIVPTVTVTLTGSGPDGVLGTADDIEMKTTTDAEGNYEFTGLDPNYQYELEFEAPDGLEFIDQDANGNANDDTDSDVDPTNGKTDVITLGPGDNLSNIDAGLKKIPPAAVVSEVFHDANHNGIRDDGEEWVAGSPVTLISGGEDGLINGVGDVVVGTLYTDGTSGSVTFPDLKPNVEYQLQFGLPDTTYDVFSPANVADADEALDSDAGVEGKSDIFTPGPGETVSIYDAGVHWTPATIEGIVWHDAVKDGIQGIDEAKISGAVVILLVDGEVLKTTTTGPNGDYLFDELDPNLEYKVRFVSPEDYDEFTQKDALEDDKVDSDADPATGETGFITFKKDENGEYKASYDAGVLINLASIENEVFVDSNRNNVRDEGELLVKDATVKLIDADSGEEIGELLTDESGKVVFDELEPYKNYRVLVEMPASYDSFSDKQAVPESGDIDSDVEADSESADFGMTDLIVLSPGEVNTVNDAGVYWTPAAITGTVWEDVDRDGFQGGEGEGGVGDVVVTLTGPGPNGQWGDDDDVLKTTSTGSNGDYTFDGLDPNQIYQITVGKPEAFDDHTDPNKQGDDDSVDYDTIDSDVYKTGKSSMIVLTPGGTADVDAGFINFPLSALEHTVFVDENGDGIHQDTEGVMEGITVTLRKKGESGTFDEIVQTLQTKSDGTVLFEDLDSTEEYQVTFEQPDGFTFTTPRAGDSTELDSDANPITGKTGSITLVAGETERTYDAGVTEIPKTIVLGRVFDDQNRDGIQDDGEKGIKGVNVTLVDVGPDGVIGGGDDTVLWVLTGDDGLYVFPDVVPDKKYQVVISKPADYDESSPKDADGNNSDDKDSDINPSTGSSDPFTPGLGSTTEIDGGLYKTPASIETTVFEDVNGDGIHNEGDLPVAGTTVILRGGGDNMVVGDDDDTYTPLETGEDGTVLFDGLFPDQQYLLTFENPEGLGFDFFSPANAAGSTEATDSDADPISGVSPLIILEPDEKFEVYDAGVMKPAVIEGTLFHDKNLNNVYDGADEVVPNAVVTLVGAGPDGVLGTADDTKTPGTTDSNGSYSFTGLKPGLPYAVEFTKPAEYDSFATKDASEDDTIDSDVTPSSTNPNVGLTDPIVLKSGETNGSNDAGVVIPPVTIGGKVWYDADRDGTQGDTGIETLVEGATVVLLFFDDDGNVIGQSDPIVTGADGSYLFDGLDPSLSYQVHISTYPGRYVGFTTPNVGSDNADSDFGTGGLSGTIKLQPGTSNVNVDAGLVTDLASIESEVFLDLNLNGIRDPDEVLLEGVQVKLIELGDDETLGGDDDTETVGPTITTPSGETAAVFQKLETFGKTYQVLFILPDGTEYVGFTTEATNDDKEEIDSNADVDSGLTNTVTLSPGETNKLLDAGLVPSVSLTGSLWHDADENGLKDRGELGISATATVTLISPGPDGVYGTGDEPDAQTVVVTGRDPTYAFNGLDPRLQYEVQVSTPEGYSGLTTPNAGDDAVDSDFDNLSGSTGLITLSTVDPNVYDAGFVLEVVTTTTTTLPPITTGPAGNRNIGEVCTPLYAGDTGCGVGEVCAVTIGDQFEVVLTIWEEFACCLTESHICNLPTEMLLDSDCSKQHVYQLSLAEVYDFVCSVDEDVYMVAGHGTMVCDSELTCEPAGVVNRRRLQSGQQLTYSAYYEVAIGCAESGPFVIPPV